MKKSSIQLALVAGLALAFVSQVNAQDIFDDGGADSNWSTAANWDNDTLPGAGNNVQIGNETFSGVTANYDAGTTVINDLRIGNGAGSMGATGTLNMNSGNLTTNGWAFVGSDANAANTNPTVATFNIGGTAVFNAGQRFYAGLGGAAGASATGTINISGNAAVNVADGFIVGGNDDNTGIVNQTGGTVTSNNWVTIGEDSGGQGQYNISAGSLTTNDLAVGQAGAGAVGTNGELNVSGTGNVTVNSALFVGREEFGAAGATGTVELDGSTGVFTVFGDAYFGGNAGNPLAGDATGDLSFIADAGGVTVADVHGSLFLNDGTTAGGSNLLVDLTADASFATFGTTGTAIEYLLVDNINNAVSGTFAGLAEGATISIGGGKTGTLSYVGGDDGNDIVLNLFVTAVPEPSTVALVSLGLFGLVSRRRRS